MKKRLSAIALSALLMTALTACGTEQASVGSANKQEVESSIPENTEHIYPFNSTSKYLDTATDLPDIVFTKRGFENGLVGSVYVFDGTVIDYKSDNSTRFIIVETSKDKVLVNDIVELTHTGEDGADYSLPEIGTKGTFYVTYSGYSNKYNMPTSILGASKLVVADLLCDESYIQENITTYVKTKPNSIEIVKTESTASITMDYNISEGKEVATIATDATKVCISACKLFRVKMSSLEMNFSNAGRIICSLTSNDGGKTFTDSTTDETLQRDELKKLSPDIVYGEGMYKVGTDIPAGEYLLTATGDFDAYFQLSSDSSGDLSSIVSNEIFSRTQYITVKNGQYLTLERCTAKLAK